MKNIEMSIQHDNYMNSTKLRSANRKLEENGIKLTFQADDIKYIIIKEEAEITNMITQLRVIKGRRYNRKTLDLLTSRIITTKQILRDF